MRIEKDHPGFLKALKAAFKNDSISRCVCAVDDAGTVLGGCGFSKVVNGVTYGYLLGLQKNWASREIYAAIMSFPFEDLKADKAIANVGFNRLSYNCCIKLGGIPSEKGTLITFTKERNFRLAEELLK